MPRDHSKTRKKRLFDSQNGLCYYCDEKLTTYHVDHKVPRALGGENLEYNLCLSCVFCNLTKSDMQYEKYLKLIEFYKSGYVEKRELRSLKRILFS